MRLLESFVAVLPAELKDVPDHFLHELKRLLDVRLSQRSEVYHPHIHLHTHTNKTHMNVENTIAVMPDSHVHTQGGRERWIAGG